MPTVRADSAGALTGAFDAKSPETIVHPHDRNIFLSTLPAKPRERMVAMVVVGVSSVIFVCTAPFASIPMPKIPAALASYQSALTIIDLLTTILLFSQFAILRSRGLLLLGSGYLFTGAIAVAHVLSFPGVFAPSGLLHAGTQTTAWLYLVWHGGFPVFVLGYGLLKDRDGGARIKGSVSFAIAGSIVGVGAAIAAVVWFVTSQHDLLPILVIDQHYMPGLVRVVSALWVVNLAALLVLLVRRPYSVLDVWIIVVMCAWLFDIALSTILNVERFDLGFYVGRIYGLFAASFVLAVQLIDNSSLQAQLSQLYATLRESAASDRHRHHEREQLFSAVVESSNDAIITITLDGIITGWNRAAERLFGFAAAEAVGDRIDIIVAADRRAEEREMLDRVARGEAIEHYETLRCHKDGKEVQIALGASPIRSATGDIIGASETARDIGESRRTQHALSQEIEERRRIFETSQDLIVIIDTAGYFVQVSPSSLTIIGHRPEDMIGRSAADFIHPDDLDSAREEIRATRRGQQTRNFETRYVHKDGQAVTLTWMASWSEPVGRFYFVGRDLTEKRAAEAQFRQAQKMQAVGQLTGGVAHDFNNILTVITGTIGIMADAVADNPQLTAIAKMIDDAADRGANLTRHLLAFARKQPLQPREVDVNSLVSETLKLLRPTLGEQIHINQQLAKDASAALVDPNQLTTAILNLSLNARDAMPSGGKLVIETRNIYLDEGYAEMHDEVVVGNYVMIAVSDTGSGIPAANLERVFDPFFTTKEVGKGTGLGLSMVFGFVKQSNGHIKIYSEEDHGTTVKVYLPRATGLSDTALESAASSSSAGGNETVLVVEDDTLVRRYVVTQIASLGYATLEASNGTEALEVIDNTGTIDLLFTDVIMPGPMNGRQLVNEALKRRPTLKTLFTSGYTENAIVHHGRLDSGVLLLAKPYRKFDLARMIRMALDS
jgi:PAS domain S-box-containing protein